MSRAFWPLGQNQGPIPKNRVGLIGPTAHEQVHSMVSTVWGKRELLVFGESEYPRWRRRLGNGVG